MSKRKAEDVPSLQHKLALEAVLDSEEGLDTVLKYINNTSNELMRSRIKTIGYVVALKDDVEKVISDTQLINDNSDNVLDQAKRATFLANLDRTIQNYQKIGIDMCMAEKRRRFESACVTHTRYGYSSNVRQYLEDGMCHINDCIYRPYNKAEESWHTYFAGPEACDWANKVLKALNVPEEKYYVHKGQRIVSVEWRARLSARNLSESDDEEGFPN